MAKAPVKKTIAKKRPIVPAEPPPIVAEITELAGNWRKRLVFGKSRPSEHLWQWVLTALDMGRTS